MKSNHERSNECLPPKKRELPSSTLPSDNCSASTPPATDSQRAENMAWLASVAGGKESGTSGRHSSGKSERPQYKTLTSDPLTSSSSSSLKLHPSSSQSPVGGTVHYTKLPHSLQFLTSPYHPPYAGYIPPQLLPPPLSSSPSTSASNRHSETSKHDQHRASLERTSMPPPPTDSTPHRVQISTSPRTVPSHHHHSHHSVQPHHGLGHGMSQVLLQYTDGSRKEEIRSRELHNGGLDMGRRFGSSESNHPKHGSKFRDSFHSSPHEVRQRVLPSDYGADDTMGLRTSVVLMPNSHGDLQLVPEKLKTSAPTHLQKGGILVGKPVHRNTSSNTTNSFTFSPPSLPQTVIQTTHHSTEPMTIGLPSTSIYPQPPLIGYITGAGGNQQAPMGYQQHLLIPGTQQVIIPVSGGGMTTLDPVTSHLTSYTQAAPFPTYVAAQKAESHDHARGLYQHAASEAVVHLPVVPAPSDQPASSTPAAGSAQSLPPYFFKGSIIQLANGELKQVEDLKTEDFIQSAEISSELKIDSSTVERIEGSHTSPDFAVVQFSVGEHRAQVSVEVLVEYPFFVFGQGWSSCCPDRTNQLLELPCTKLSVGDVCISLTLKNMKNGSLTKYQSLDHLTEPSSGHLKASRSASDAPQRCSGGGSREQENGVRGRGNADVRNGDLTFGDKLLKDPVAGSGKTTGGRKRRWSAPEGRSVDKSEYEPPLTLPRPSFIPHEVKLSIEGRSNIGK